MKGVKLGLLGPSPGMAGPIVTKFVLCYRDQVAMHIAQIMFGWAHLHLHTYTRADVPTSRISGTTGRIALTFGVRFETHKLGVL